MNIKWREELWEPIILKESQKQTEEKNCHRQVEQNSFYDYEAPEQQYEMPGLNSFKPCPYGEIDDFCTNYESCKGKCTWPPHILTRKKSNSQRK